MAMYPRTQTKIAALADSMIYGFGEHPDYFPSATPAALEAARAEYRQASEALDQIQAAARLAAVEKAEKLRGLTSAIKVQLKRAQADAADFPEKLTVIGWDKRRAGRRMQPPRQPRYLRVVSQGTGLKDGRVTGTLHLVWDKSRQSRARMVSFYSIERRAMDCPDPARAWRQAASATGSQIHLSEEPAGVRLEYRVRAVNKAGQSGPSNTVALML